MADIDVNQIMVQMRAMAAAAQSSTVAQPAAATSGADFASLLKNSVDQVNATQQQSTGLAEAFAKGDPNTDLTEVMVAMQKASLSFQAMTTVRNKLVEAYKDVMNMPM
ncbi:MAG: flagellar hook-basal body complex protein FliE [Gammaproteobacteria bacterium]|nr:flagellar hook-basal body complex protein FliE [Gammaproteobacteria bacterium]